MSNLKLLAFLNILAYHVGLGISIYPRNKCNIMKLGQMAKRSTLAVQNLHFNCEHLSCFSLLILYTSDHSLRRSTHYPRNKRNKLILEHLAKWSTLTVQQICFTREHLPRAVSVVSHWLKFLNRLAYYVGLGNRHKAKKMC